MPLRGGGGGGSTPNGKNHLKFPFWLFEPLPYEVTLVRTLNPPLCCAFGNVKIQPRGYCTIRTKSITSTHYIHLHLFTSIDTLSWLWQRLQDSLSRFNQLSWLHKHSRFPLFHFDLKRELIIRCTVRGSLIETEILTKGHQQNISSGI